MENLLEAFSKIKAFIFDVDGVMTDGGLHIAESGEHLRTFNVKDGWAINKALKEGYPIIVISAGIGGAVQKRLEYLKIPHIYMATKDKLAKYEELKQELNLKDEEIAYMGDDIPDLKILKRTGLPCCPADAVTDVINNCVYISSKNGGKGAVRELIEKILRVQDKWNIE